MIELKVGERVTVTLEVIEHNLTSIGGEEIVFDGKNIDTDVRFGCLAWGIKPKKD